MKYNKQTKLRISIATGIAIFFGCLALSSVYINGFFKGPRDPTDFSNSTFYEIDPRNILEELDKGDINVFTKVSSTPDSYEKSYFSPFPWSQSDYIRIANSLSQYTGNDVSDGWHVYNMVFYGECQYDPVGFDQFKIIYFKDVGPQKYNAREISIYPLNAGASMSTQSGLDRPMFGLNNLNLEKFKVSADEAIQVAEEHGGSDARLAIGNQCSISVSTSGQDWHVRYADQNPLLISSIFELNINSQNGKYKVLDINK